MNHHLCAKGALRAPCNSTWFSGYASTYTQDAVGDVIMPGAFTKTLQYWLQHQGRFPHVYLEHNIEVPIGVCIELKEDLKGLFIRGKLIHDFPESRHILPVMKGSKHGVSIGFFTRQSYTRKGVRYITELSLHEISLVKFPCNTEAWVSCTPNTPQFLYQRAGNEVEHSIARLQGQHWL